MTNPLTPQGNKNSRKGARARDILPAPVALTVLTLLARGHESEDAENAAELGSEDATLDAAGFEAIHSSLKPSRDDPDSIN